MCCELVCIRATHISAQEVIVTDADTACFDVEKIQMETLNRHKMLRTGGTPFT